MNCFASETATGGPVVQRGGSTAVEKQIKPELKTDSCPPGMRVGDIDQSISSFEKSVQMEWNSLPSEVRSKVVKSSMETIDFDKFSRERFQSFIKEQVRQGGVWKTRACEVFKKAGQNYRISGSAVGC